MIVCGGGGASKTGVPNKLIIFEAARVEDLSQVEKVSGKSASSEESGSVLPSVPVGTVLMRKVCVYDTGSDAIMNMALHPTENLLACGVGVRCRVYNIGHRNFQQIGEVVTDYEENEEERGQKRVRFSPCGNFIFCSGGDGTVRMFAFPSLVFVKQFIAHSLEKERETIDLSVTRKMMATTTRKRCLIYDIHTGSILHTITPQNNKMAFRDTRFCPILQIPDNTPSDDVDENDDAETLPSSPSRSQLNRKHGRQSSSSSSSVQSPKGSVKYATSGLEALVDETTFDDKISSSTSSIEDNAAEYDQQSPSSASPSSASKSRREGTSNIFLGSSSTTIFTPDSLFLYTTEFLPKQLGVIRKWDTRTWKNVATRTIRFNSDHLTAFNVSPDGSTLAVGSVEGQVRIFDAQTLGEVKKWPTKHEFFVTDFAFEIPAKTSPSLEEMRQSASPSSSLASSILSNMQEGAHVDDKSLPVNRRRTNGILFSTSGDNTVRATLIPILSTKRRSSFLWTFLMCLFVFLLLLSVLLGTLVYAQIHYPTAVQSTFAQIATSAHENLGLDIHREVATVSQSLERFSILVLVEIYKLSASYL